MLNPNTLADHFLIAMPMLRNTNFVRGVTYLCQHSEDGAMGLLINRLSEYRLGDVLAQMNLSSELQEVIDAPVLIGGPMQPERGFVLHAPQGAWDSSYRISDSICVTTSRDILAAIAEGQGPQQVLIALGYASWGAGQIEQELKENSWLTANATRQILFETPLDERWESAAALVGVKLTHLTHYAGHA